MKKNTITITDLCPFCKKTTTSLELTYAEVAALQSGKLIQHALPHRTAEEREFLINGMCYDCQKKFFDE